MLTSAELMFAPPMIKKEGEAVRKWFPGDARKVEILREAYREIEGLPEGIHDFTCNAIKRAGGHTSVAHQLTEDYDKLFSPEPTADLPWSELWNGPNKREIRLTLLAFAIALAEAGDL